MSEKRLAGSRGAIIHASIWRDDDWRDLSNGAQWAYLMLLSLPNIERDGTVTITARRWSRYAADLTDHRILTWLDELEAAGYVEIDRDVDALRIIERHGCRFIRGGRVGPSRRKIPIRIRHQVFTRDGHRCVYCGSTDRLSLDHVHPYSLGGTDDPDNLQTLCRSCNSKKGARV